MPHSEVTHPQAPPAREIYRANPTTPEAETVRALGEQFKRSAEILFTGFRTEASYSELKSATDNAGQYSSSISRFWSHARENACDRYLHQKLDGNDWHVDTAWFNGDQ